MKLISFIVILLMISSYAGYSQHTKKNWRIKSDHGIHLPDSSMLMYGNVLFINGTDTITADTILTNQHMNAFTFKSNVVMKTYHIAEGNTALLKTDKLEYSRRDNDQ